jgi:hypothetical protein
VAITRDTTQSPRASLVRFISQSAAASGAFAGSPAQFSGETDRVAEEPVSSEPVSTSNSLLHQHLGHDRLP